MQRKLILILFCIMLGSLMIPLASAETFTFDNVLNYKDNDMTVDIISILSLKKLGTIELKSHNSIDEIKKVGAGNQVVMWYDFEDWNFYENGLGEVQFKDMSTKQEIQKEYSFVYWGEKERNVYGNGKCSLNINGTEICENVVVGKEIYNDWLPLNLKDIPEGKTRIGLMTYVEIGDYIDAVWTIAGKKVKRHASWTAALNTGLVAYYTLNDTAGETIDSTGNYNGIIAGGLERGVTGKINLSYRLDGVDSYMTTSLLPDMADVDVMTTCAWVNFTNTNANKAIYGIDWWTDEAWFWWFSGTTLNWVIRNGAEAQVNAPMTTGVINDGSWHFICGRANSTHIILNVDNVLENVVAYDGAISPTTANFTIGGFLGTAVYYTGNVDEVAIWNRSLTDAEITQLWNGGTGITYTTEFGNIVIDLLSPEDDANLTDNTPTLSSNVTVDDILGIENVTINVYNVSGNIFTETNTSKTPFVYNFTTTELIDGSYKWNLTAYGNDSNAYTSATYDFTIDILYPQINITVPTQNQNFNYLLYGNNITLNVTITDARLHTCWYEYNLTNKTFSCTTGVEAEINLTITNETTAIVWANDSSEKLNSSSVSWTFDLFDFNENSYSTSAIESSVNVFSNKFQTKDSLTSSYLEYNNTNYSASATSQAEKIYLISYSPTAPTVGLDTNISWNFWVNNVNSTKHNQTVINLLGDDCTTYPHHFLNFTLFDEENPTIKLVNTTIKYAFDFYNLEGTSKILEVNGTSSTNPFGVCFNTTINDTILTLTGSVQFYANTSTTNYVIRYYNFLNYTITNETIPVNTSLYDINSSKTLPFLLTFRDETLALAPSVLVHVDKEYLETNDFKTVEIPITDTNGQAILNLVRNTAVYNFIMLNSSRMVVASFTNVVAFCQDYTIGSCSIDLSASSVGDSTYNYDEDVGISYILSYSNSSKLVSLTFSSINSSNQDVEIIVLSENQFENQTICSNTLTAASGTVSCDVSSALDTNQFLFVEVYSNDELISTEIVNANLSLPSKGGIFGINGFFLAFLFMLFLILLFSDDKQVLVIVIGVGWITVLSLGLIRGAIIGSASGGIWLIVTILIFLWKLKEEEKI